MSTRATYEIKTRHGRRMTFYIHHDGYPEYAWKYFYNALFCENRRGGLADMFHRANDGAEFTGSHDSHGDTEYRYSVREDDSNHGEFYITCQHRRPSEKEWHYDGGFSGPLEVFINKQQEAYKRMVANYYERNGQHMPSDEFAGIEPVHRFGSKYTTRGRIIREILDKKQAYAAYKEKFPMHTGNFSHYESEIAKAEGYLRQIEDAEARAAA